mgnify:CR=1 FL=1
MKNVFYALTFMLLMFSCTSDDDNQNTEATLNGSWHLVNISGGLVGVNDDFDTGLITWIFNENNLELTVINTNTTDVIFDGLASGTYNYQPLTTTGENTDIVVDFFSFRITTLTTVQLILDEGIAADGFLLTFSR